MAYYIGKHLKEKPHGMGTLYVQIRPDIWKEYSCYNGALTATTVPTDMLDMTYFTSTEKTHIDPNGKIYCMISKTVYVIMPHMTRERLSIEGFFAIRLNKMQLEMSASASEMSASASEMSASASEMSASASYLTRTLSLPISKIFSPICRYMKFSTILSKYVGNFVDGVLNGFVTNTSSIEKSKTETMYQRGIPVGRQKITNTYIDSNQYYNIEIGKDKLLLYNKVTNSKYQKKKYNEIVKYSNIVTVKCIVTGSRSVVICCKQNDIAKYERNIHQNGTVEIIRKYNLDGHIS